MANFTGNMWLEFISVSTDKLTKYLFTEYQWKFWILDLFLLYKIMSIHTADMQYVDRSLYLGN